MARRRDMIIKPNGALSPPRPSLTRPGPARPADPSTPPAWPAPVPCPPRLASPSTLSARPGDYRGTVSSVLPIVVRASIAACALAAAASANS